jgi:hypothetical protein
VALCLLLILAVLAVMGRRIFRQPAIISKRTPVVDSSMWPETVLRLEQKLDEIGATGIDRRFNWLATAHGTPI